MGLDAAMDGLVAAINEAVNAAGLAEPDQVGKGEPVGIDLIAILKSGGWVAAVYPLASHPVTEYAAGVIGSTSTVPTLTADVAGNTVTFAGSVAPNVPVHVGIDQGLADVAYVTAAGDTALSVAGAVRVLINALGLPGVTASVAGGVLTVVGASSVSAMVAASAAMTIETGRSGEHLQVTVWAPDGPTRAAIYDAIVTRVGTSEMNTIVLADGTSMDCWFVGKTWSDQSSALYSAYIAHIVFECEFSLTRTTTATQIAAGSIAASPGDGSTLTRYTSGG